MNPRQQEHGESRETLRAYLLGTLDDAEHARVEARIAASPELQAELEDEERALARLDVLPAEKPRPDLTAEVLDRVRRIENETYARREQRMYLGGHVFEFVAAGVIIVVAAAILLPALGRARESARRASSQNNLKQMGLVFKMYSNEAPNQLFPPPGDYDALWTPDLKTIYPEFLTDLMILIDPDNPRFAKEAKQLQKALQGSPPNWRQLAEIAADNLVYLPWVARNDEDVTAMAAARRNMKPQDYDKDIVVGDRKLFRLRDGVAALFITNVNHPGETARIESEIPIMFTSNYHIPAGRNVLYLDGHIEFVRYGKFPCTKAVNEALGLSAPK